MNISDAMPRRQGRHRIRRVAAGLALLSGLVNCAGAPRAGASIGGRTPDGIAFDVRGEGTPVVLVHGAFLDRRQWNPQRPLERNFTIIRYDTRWHGRSANASVPFSAADDLRGVLEATGLATATIVGLSNGARIAIDFALAHPERVTGLILVSPDVDGFKPAERPPFWKALGDALGRGDVDAAAAALATSPVMAVTPRDTGWVRPMVREHARVFRGNAALERRGVPPALARLGEIRVPTRVVIGSADLMDIRRAGREIAAGIQGATLTEFAGATHLLTVTDAERFNRLVLEFVGGNHRR